MSKQTQKKTTEEQETLSHTALGVFQHPDSKEWCLAHIKYDPTTGITKFETAKSFGKDQLEACQQFKIEAINTGNIV